MKISVFGNRSIVDKEKVVEYFWDFCSSMEEELDVPSGITYLWGGAEGPARLVAEELRDKTDIVLFKPWHMVDFSMKFNPKFFFFRNKQIIENSDAVLIFSTGEKDAEVYKTVEFCEQRKKNYLVVQV